MATSADDYGASFTGAYTICKKCLLAKRYAHDAANKITKGVTVREWLSQVNATRASWVCNCDEEHPVWQPEDLQNPAVACEIIERTGVSPLR